MYGSPERGTEGLLSSTVGPEQARIMLQDACFGEWEDAAAHERCPTFYQGVMTHGVHAAISSFVQHIRELLTRRERSGREATILSRSMQVMEEFDDHYLWQALWTSNSIYERVRSARVCARVAPSAQHTSLGVAGRGSAYGPRAANAVAHRVAVRGGEPAALCLPLSPVGG